VAIALGCCLIAALAWLTWTDTSARTSDGRQEIIAWGITFFGEDVHALVHRFEQENPQYKVTISHSAARDADSDGQRLLCAIAGGVPPDVVFFSRFATGEWASRGALLDLRPMLAAQRSDDPQRIDLSEYYDFAVAEASYRPPGSTEESGIYGIPTSADLRILYINNQILRQEGLVDEKGDPRPPRTWDELRDYSKRLTVYRTPGDPRSGIRRLGFAPNFGNSWLYLYAWQAGGHLLSDDGTRVTMDSPEVVRALRFMTEIYDDLGGVRQVDAFQQGLAGESVGGSFRASSFAAGDLDPFLRGAVVMKIDNDYSMRTIGDWRPNMDFQIVAAPMPADQLSLGKPPVTWSGGFSLVIPTTSRNKEGAFKLIQYITSRKGMQFLERGKRERRESEGKMYLPEGLANRKQFEEIAREAIHDNPRVPKTFKDAYRVLADLMPHTYHRPVTPVGQLLWNQHVRAYEAAVGHEFAAAAKAQNVDEVKLTLATLQQPVQRQLDEILRPPPPTKVTWWPYFLAYGAAIVAPLVAIRFAYRRRRRAEGFRSSEVRAAMLFLSPWLIGFAVLLGGPIVFSLVISFTRYDVLSDARYVGGGNFRELLADPLFGRSVLNTLYMLIRIPLMMVISLAIALILNRAVRAIGFYRTAFYMPAIVPMVAASLLWVWLFNPTQGVINGMLTWLFDTRLFAWLERVFDTHFIPPLWLSDPQWSKPSLIIMSAWTAGASMIIWLAGLQSINPALYEAASIDGAGAWRKFRHVTLPMLSPYVLFNSIVGVIGTMQIFGEAFVMTAGGPAESTMFYAYYLFKQAFQYFRMGYASALAWILFLIVLGLTILQLAAGRRWVHYEQA
jgi:multiple sugar transport system permease protein